MKIVTTTITNIDHLTVEQAIEFCLRMREAGRRSEIMSDTEAKRRGLLEPMQDLSKVTDWKQIP